ncbi:MAG: IMP cyclohydrolase [Christensenellaceae bacterium]|nr:IMP cyclohydrolase [Christensenellaceae bacterium]MEA5066030.1 IMP cyclohydrolase [Eubacteriales bacterium]MEA5067998.1 IMP cyclohydrolase [Christensenellaceae bacterium]
MNLTDLHALSAYPGRGILLGAAPDGRALIAYFLMGRSLNSRNRVLAPDAAGLRAQAFDPAKVEDPSLIIYAPLRALGNRIIVSNGDQTDTIRDFLMRGETFEAALDSREYEPDAPNYTPRISGLMTFESGGFSYQLSIVKRGAGCERFFFRYEAPKPGLMHLIHTYRPGADPLKPFEGEPTPLETDLEPAAFARALWNALDPDNKVALFVRAVDPAAMAFEDHIINRLEEEASCSRSS